MRFLNYETNTMILKLITWYTKHTFNKTLPNILLSIIPVTKLRIPQTVNPTTQHTL